MTDPSRTSSHHRIVIAGGGTAGLSVAASLLRESPQLDVAVIEPSDDHYYQPGWTLVGGGDMRARDTHRHEADVMPDKATWIKDAVAGFAPDDNHVKLASGAGVSYDFLVVALGLQLDWDAIEGLPDTLGANGVTSNYRYDLAPYTHELARGLGQGANALFTQPAMPIKCAGAPQKALYLTADTLRKRGVQANVAFYNQGGAMFGVPAYARALDDIIAGYGATPHFKHNLVAVDGPARQAVFDTDDGQVTRDFDMLHVVPPQSAPDVVKNSPLAGDAGWVSVDKNRLTHTRYDNVYALGDCTDTPNAKTMAAVRRQFPVLVGELRTALGERAQRGDYDGYGACPLTVAHGKVLLAEFRYGGEVVSSFPLDPRVARRIHWPLKSRGFPWMYWHVMLKGRDWHWPEPKPRPDLTA
ncbi:NAD(P)/FAD-dependent oxidoreductase [Salinisphaera orenii]|uniref:FAD-dependent pyridine nucleotide-disulfide oxidoreductase n=1 Tax=Salinisphaera orenii YIM 95161 TaxID=1051139 RepID=A0A423PGT6_9GAMM|nr:FAD/NAD(P)-binding oxidoreductase [Salinisphaera halophila]ROO24775.1 FAD-dependent pyridine nucleotide-disulfide oxidoreductase [Salinisphaera halophila YIM 95161]